MSRPTWGDEVSEALGSFSLWIFHYFLLFFFFRLRSHNFYFWILLLTFSCSDEIPPTTIVGPDSNGIKIVTEYYIDEDGKKFKVFFLFFFFSFFFFFFSIPAYLLACSDCEEDQGEKGDPGGEPRCCKEEGSCWLAGFFLDGTDVYKIFFFCLVANSTSRSLEVRQTTHPAQAPPPPTLERIFPSSSTSRPRFSILNSHLPCCTF